MSRCGLGIDVGGTKCAAGVVCIADGHVLAQSTWPTAAHAGGATLLQQIAVVVRQLLSSAAAHGGHVVALGLGVPELVDASGGIVSAATLDWQSLPVAEQLASVSGLPVTVDADVRAAARGEAILGSGREYDPFLYVTIGTGISVCLVQQGCPYLGARGLTGTFASSGGLIPGDAGELLVGPPLEQYAAGPALAARYAKATSTSIPSTQFTSASATSSAEPTPPATPPQILALAQQGDPVAGQIVASAGRAVGAALAQLVNLLDPAAIIVGGGLGLAEGLYRRECERACREFVWSEQHRQIPMLSAQLGTDAGWIGAALSAAMRATS